MNSTKNKFSGWFNPINFKLENKIHFLTFSLVAFTILVLSIAGLYLFRKALIRNTYENLDKIADLKANEVEMRIIDYSEKIVNISYTDKLQNAVNELKTGFNQLKDEKSEMFATDTLEKMQVALSRYYNDELSGISPVTQKNIIAFLPDNDLTLVAQTLFLYLNPKKVGEKSEFVLEDGYFSYALAHKNYQPYFQELCKKWNASDILLIDAKSGNVIYTVAKNIDFGTNLFDGRFRKSSLAKAFRKSLATARTEVSFTDFESSPATFDQSMAYLSVPVFSNNEIIGICAVQFDSRLFDDVLFDKLVVSRQGTLDFSVIGDDLLLRNNSRCFLSDREGTLKKIKKRAGRSEMKKILQVESLGNMVNQVNYPLKTKEYLNTVESALLTDYQKTSVYAGIKKLNIKGADLYLLAKMDQSEALGHLYRLLKYLFLLMLPMMIAVFFIGRIFGRALTLRIDKLNNSLLQLYKGEKPKPIEWLIHDEIGQTIDTYNNLRNRIIATSEFALEMSESNFSHEFETLDDNDSLGKSMNVLKEKMIQSKEEHEIRIKEDEIRNWINTGIATFNDLLRQNSNNIEALSYSIIEKMIEYVKANQGGIFLVDGEENEEKTLRLIAGYAYDRRKYLKEVIGTNEGLLGTCYQEKLPIYLKDIPDDYLQIGSGLGQSKPSNLYISPLKVDDKVLGIMEIASFHEFEKFEIDFIDKVSEGIAATFVSVKLNMQTAYLLKESGRRSEEIAQQEEEMRQNIEEMHATQEELTRAKQEDEIRTRELQEQIDNSRKLLRNLLEAIPGGYILKDQNGVIHMVNNEGADFYGLSISSVLGKTDHELLSFKLYERENSSDQKAMEGGMLEYKEKKEIMGELKNFRVIKKPFFIDEIHQTGILTIRYFLEE
jgi:PAS domain S-box-containing protein